jgi:hypothetical protein
VKPLIVMINQDLANDTEVNRVLAAQGAQNPITTHHSPWMCERCEADCWIGPKQKLTVVLQGYEAVCYRCLFKDADVMSQDTLPMITLNPDIENAPRRFT